MKAWRSLCFSFLILMLAVSAVSAEMQHYQITDLGKYDDIGIPVHINNRGDVIFVKGGQIGERRSFLRRHAADVKSGNTIIEITEPGVPEVVASGINDAGVVVGTKRTRDANHEIMCHAFKWEEGKITDLMEGQKAELVANGINNAGDITCTHEIIERGFSFEHFIPIQSFLLKAGKLQDLGNLGTYYCEVRAINDKGHVAGIAKPSADTIHAFFWKEGKLTDLGTLGGPRSFVVDMNKHDQIIGYSDRTDKDTRTGLHHSFLWENGVMKDLDTATKAPIWAAAINDAGTIVGMAGDDTDRHAVMLQHGKIIDLNSLLPKDSGWHLGIANDINNRGQIIGYGSYKGKEHAFLLTPVK
jgi:probable HAF family extracellular repeat protein